MRLDLPPTVAHHPIHHPELRFRVQNLARLPISCPSLWEPGHPIGLGISLLANFPLDYGMRIDLPPIEAAGCWTVVSRRSEW